MLIVSLADVSKKLDEAPSEFRADNAGIFENWLVLCDLVIEEGGVGDKVFETRRAGIEAAFFNTFEAVSFEIHYILCLLLATDAFPLEVEPADVGEGSEEIFRELSRNFFVSIGDCHVLNFRCKFSIQLILEVTLSLVNNEIFTTFTLKRSSIVYFMTPFSIFIPRFLRPTDNKGNC